MILPGSTMKYHMAISTEEIRKALTKTEGAYFVLGRIDYEDAANHYWTTICWYYDITLLSLSVWSSDNEAFSEKKKPNS
jgi:hypothetical protein